MKVPIPKTEIRRLEALRNYHILDSAPAHEIDDFVKLASHICGVPLATLTFVDGDRHWFTDHLFGQVAYAFGELGMVGNNYNTNHLFYPCAEASNTTMC